MENNNYENLYETSKTHNKEVVVDSEKVGMRGAKKVWIIILSVFSLSNGAAGLIPLFLWVTKPVVGRLFLRVFRFWYVMPWETKSLSGNLQYSIIIDFVCGVIAIIGFIVGLIAYKISCKYEKNKVTIMAKIAKFVGLAGIILNLLLGIIFIINRIVNG